MPNAKNLTPTEHPTAEARLVEGGHIITDDVHGDLFVWNVRANARWVYFETITAFEYSLGHETAVKLPRTTYKTPLRAGVAFA